jgi:Zn-dependent protease
MSDSSSWSLPLWRWRRVQVRVHALFFVVGVFVVLLATGPGEPSGVGYGILAIAVLLGSVLAHEAGHLVAAARMGGNGDPVVIGPLGGMGHLEVPREPHAELITVLAGPLVNLAVLLAMLGVLLVAGTPVPSLLSPLAPGGLLQGPWWLVTLKLTFWVNWLLLLANLLPAFPLDGARMLRAVVWPALDYRGATLVAVRASKLTAIGLCVWAWLVRDAQSAPLLPSWVPLVLLAVLVYFSAVQESARSEESDWGDELFSYDFSQGYTSLERSSEPRRPSGGVVQRWLKNRRELRRRRRESQELEEERQVDEVLMRLHERGMDGLSDQERALLERVSARYRNRQRN